MKRHSGWVTERWPFFIMHNELYTDEIFDYAECKKCRGTLTNCTHHAEGANTSCGDEVAIDIIIKDGVVIDIKIDDTGCIISTASAAMMCEKLKGLEITEVNQILDGIKQGKFPADQIVLQTVARNPVRIKCAMLPWVTIRSIIS